MYTSASLTNGFKDSALIAELSDVALTHGQKGLCGISEDQTLSRWYEKKRELSTGMPIEADPVLIHGKKESAALPGSISLSLWYKQEHAMSALLPAEADFALTHGTSQGYDQAPCCAA